MRTSEGTDKLYAALAQAQAVIADPAKTKKGQSGRGVYKYAPLDAILPHVRATLSACGLCITQGAEHRDYGWVLVTRLGHASGQWQETDYPMGSSDDPQKQGSAWTYSRRYSVQGALGIHADDDDDGAAAKDSEVDARRAEAEAKKDGAARKKAEKARDDAARKAYHHPSWADGGRERFCASLAPLGWTYDDLCAALEADGIRRPSSWPDDKRTALLVKLAAGTYPAPKVTP